MPTCGRLIEIGLCPKMKNHPLCGWIFIIFDYKGVPFLTPNSANLAELETVGENGPVSNSEVKELTYWLELLPDL